MDDQIVKKIRDAYFIDTGNATQEDILKAAKAIYKEMVKELVSVQPMDPNLMKDLWEASKDGPTEQELRDAGYEPVSHLKLAWIKKDKDENV